MTQKTCPHTYTCILQGVLAASVISSAWVIWRNYLAPNPLDNIPGPASKSLLTGNLTDAFSLYGREYHEMLLDRYGGIVKFTGLLGSRLLCISDATALHSIVIKDHAYWQATEEVILTNKMVFGNGLVSVLGDQHRKQRKMLNPVFSIAHMRHMIPIFTEVSSKLRNSIAEQVKNGPAEINMLEWFTRTALELIGQSGLGYSFDSLEGPDANEYSRTVKNLVSCMVKTALPRLILPWIVKVTSPKFRRTIADMIPWAALQELLYIADFMGRTSSNLLEEKRKAIAEGDEALIQQVGRGKDIMSVLLKANMSASEQDRLADDELLGQMTTLTFAAMDTTSSALSRTIYLLSHHPEVQEKLREEYRQMKGDRGSEAVTYDDLVNLPYLDAVCRETLRLYPPFTSLLRSATKDIILPFAHPVKGVNGKELNEVLVPKGTMVLLSFIGANCNKEVWGEDALEWKPERWLKPLPSTVTESQTPGVYSHLMTFSGGGRSCIGFKFSQLEMKVVLSLMLDSFKFSPIHEIEWTVGLSSPRVKGSEDKSFRLPMRVELLDGESS